MDNQAKIDHIVQWLSNYLKTSKAKGFVVGVSGGIDSALTSTLCAQTHAPVLCLEMEIHQEQNQVSRATNHIAWLQKKFKNVSSHSISMTDTYEKFVQAQPQTTLLTQTLSLANTRARLRMSTLYYFATLHSYLVAGTGNKVEDFGIGFYTKYGDGGVDLSPIADLMKTEVFALAKTLGVNQEILVAPPTDGLWGDDRTDEDQIGASYPELEWAMTHQHEDSMNFTERQKEVMSIYTNYHKKNKHKMVPIPVCEIPKN